MTESAAPLRIVSTSRASDGSFTAISEIGALLRDSPHRLIGGVAVVLHQHRLGLAHPVRATADADFGVPPYALRDDSLVAAVSLLGDVVLAEGWSSAWGIVTRHPEVRAVTPEGDVITTHGMRLAQPDGAGPAALEAAGVALEQAELSGPGEPAAGEGEGAVGVVEVDVVGVPADVGDVGHASPAELMAIRMLPRSCL